MQIQRHGDQPGDPGGDRAELVNIRVEINGHACVFMIESYTGSTRHGDQRWMVQGVSRTHYMAGKSRFRR